MQSLQKEGEIKDKMQIFVDMEGDRKVSAETRLNNIVNKITDNTDLFSQILKANNDLNNLWDEMINKINKAEEKNYQALKKFSKEKDKKKDFEKPFIRFNNELLKIIINLSLIDIRMFGGAFAVSGFDKTFTGPIQINWGYSLNNVELVKSNSIVTIMNDDNSTFGDDHRVCYSLLAFHGTVNKYFANQTGLTENDLKEFRHAIYDAIPALPTRSKLEQYPVLYCEIQYKEGFNGYLGDLRNHIDFAPNCEEQKIRHFKDINLDFSRLIERINSHKSIIEKVYLGKNESCNFNETILQIPVEIISPYPMLV